MKRPLHELGRGDVFRTADGRLWVRTHESLHPDDRFYCVGILHDVAVALAGDTEVEPIDLPALLVRLGDLEKENRDLRGMVADLWDESRAARLGAEAERGAVLADMVLAQVAAHGEGDAVTLCILHDFTECFTSILEARGPTRPPVPPCALEGAVREAVAVLACWHLGHWHTVPATERAALLARLRAALGEAKD